MRRWTKLVVSGLAVALAFSACSSTDERTDERTDDSALAAPTTAEAAPETTAATAPETTVAAAPPPTSSVRAPATTAPAPAETAPAPATTAPAPATTAPPPATTAPPPTTTTATTAPPGDDQQTAVPPSVDGVGDSFYPWAGNSGYDVTHYDLVLDVDPDANLIEGVTKVHAVSTAELATFHLDLYGLDVAAVWVNGDVAGFSRSETELIVQPSAPVAAGVTFTVEVVYSGVPQFFDDPGTPDFEIGWFNHDDVVYTANQPSGAMTWFPSNNHPTDKSTFTITITVPEHLTAASNGLLVSDTVAEGRRTATWHTDDPMAAYLAAVYIGEFERHEHQVREGLLIRDYIPSTLSDEQRQATLDALSITPGAMEFFEDLLGPHPFDAYGTLVLPFSVGYAMENQTLSLHGDQTVTPLIIAHELAHAWFGNSVSLGDWSDIWLNEGFAHYLAFLYVAHHEGSDIEDLMAGELEAARTAQAAPPGAIAVQQLFDFPSVYQRSTLTLHALHRHLGDEKFVEVLRRHYRQSAHRSATTADLMAIVEHVGGAEALALLASWLYSPEMPSTLDP